MNISEFMTYVTTDKLLRMDIEQAYIRFSTRGYKLVGIGRNRAVFSKAGYVVKVPINYNGIIDNEWEAAHCGNAREGCVQHARTRSAFLGGLQLCLMEFVEYATTEDIIERIGHEPSWVWGVDCGQVGWNRKGKLVAFDFGYC